MAQRPSIFKLASEKRVSNNSFVLEDLERLCEHFNKMENCSEYEISMCVVIYFSNPSYFQKTLFEKKF